MRQGKNYPLRPVVSPVVGDSDTNRPLPTNCQNAYSSCGVGNDFLGEMNSLSDDLAIRQIVASMGQGQQSRTMT